ncbi:MAG: hypothetical protein WCG84_00835 [Candidatus Moraniibacteriota bacterium]
MNKPIAAIDLDDVLGHFVPAFFAHHNIVYGTTFQREDIFSYDFLEVLEVSQKEVLKRVEEYANAYLLDIEPIQEAQIAIEQLYQSHELHIITARGEEFSEVTDQWLRRHFPGMFSRIHFVGHYTTYSREKSVVCDELQAVIFIDDSLRNVSGHTASDRQIFLLDAPWNQSDEMMHNVKRVFSWQEIMDSLT